MTRPEASLSEITDLIVVGAGMAGFCCAIEAARLGVQVLLLEKEQNAGGSSALSGGSFAFAGTDEQRAVGVADSSAAMLRDLREVGDNKNDEALLQAFGSAQLATYRWLQAMGFRFGPPKAAAGQSIPRTHRVPPQEVFVSLNDAARECGRVVLLRSTGATRLIRSTDCLNVVGVSAMVDDRSICIGSRCGAVLATGGFMRSESLLEKFAPGQAKALRMGSAGCTGDGLRMAWQLGAVLRGMGFIKGTFGIHPSAGPEDHLFLHSVYLGAIAVNQRAQRFVNESLSYKLIGEACLAQPDAIGFQIPANPSSILLNLTHTTSLCKVFDSNQGSRVASM